MHPLSRHLDVMPVDCLHTCVGEALLFNAGSPSFLQRLPRVALLLLKPLLQAVSLLWAMLVRMPAPKVILLQVLLECNLAPKRTATASAA